MNCYTNILDLKTDIVMFQLINENIHYRSTLFCYWIASIMFYIIYSGYDNIVSSIQKINQLKSLNVKQLEFYIKLQR